MIFDWSLAILSLAGGFILLISASLSSVYEKTIFAPATAMLLTWGAALIALSFLPLMGFYHLSAKAVILFVLGSGWFAFVAVLTSWVLSGYTQLALRPATIGPLDHLDFSRLLFFWAAIALFTYPLAVLNVLSFGSNIVEISYNIRMASLAGDAILHPVVSNFFVLLGVLTNIVFFGVIQKKVKLVNFLMLVAPLIVISLIISGRSGLVSLILGWLVILAVFSDKLKLRYLLLPIIFLGLVMYFGGVWVKKFDVEGQSASNALIVLMDHVFGYLYQGPVLFSRYFTGEIDIATKWDFLDSACHMLLKLNLCEPIPLHQSFENYGEGLSGNVYSMYYSIIPNYGLLGLVVVFGLYAFFLSALFNMMKLKRVFAVAVYPVMFSAIALSPFKDGIGYAFYWLIKVAIICFLIKKFFLRRRRKSITMTVSIKELI